MKDSKELSKIVQINVKVTVQQKRKLQDLANVNSDGDVTALIKMLAEGVCISVDTLTVKGVK